MMMPRLHEPYYANRAISCTPADTPAEGQPAGQAGWLAITPAVGLPAAIELANSRQLSLFTPAATPLLLAISY